MIFLMEAKPNTGNRIRASFIKPGILSHNVGGIYRYAPKSGEGSGANLKSKARVYLWNKNEAVHELCQPGKFKMRR